MSTGTRANAHTGFVVVIPAFKPQLELISLLKELSLAGVKDIVVVDDGSGPEFAPVFEGASAQSIHVLHHAVNLGKGAALKTGINYALCTFPGSVGVVTADADGQHSAADIVKVGNMLAEQRDALILGRREFSADVPSRSRFGNLMTRLAVQFLVGKRISDTQTGLRGIPASFAARLLHIGSSGYEFELDMLITAKHHGYKVTEVPIETIYLEGNASSHFNPLRDSMRVYFALLRFSGVAVVTALIDNAIFLAAFQFGGDILASQVLGRAAAVIFNYTAARKAVFFSRRKHADTLPSYLMLVVASGAASYTLIRMLGSTFGWHVVPAKLTAEGLLFLVNFIIQRDWVFTRTAAIAGATDWDKYYRSVAPTARLTRKYTRSVLLRLISRFGGEGGHIVELGGANSCFIDAIRSTVRPATYDVVDNNRFGLELLSRRIEEPGVALHEQDVLALSMSLSSDLAFSVGLIEHFESAGTREAIRAHFRLVKPGGVVIVTFPTPTWLYRAARAALEKFHLWQFPDERPLGRDEVYAAARECGEFLHEEMLWPLVLTQRVMAFRKSQESGAAQVR